MAEWTYSASTKRYRSKETGRFLSKAQVLANRNQFIAGARANSDSLIRSLQARTMTLPNWVLEMREVVLRAHTAEYLLGRGGRNAMRPSDWGHLGAMMREQYRYIQGFAEDLGRGILTVEAALARGHLYTDAAVTAFERGRVAAHGMPDLPAYPGDGRTPCLVSCKCYWDITETTSSWRATWRLGPTASEHCEGCRARAQQYAPYVIDKPTERALRLVS